MQEVPIDYKHLTLIGIRRAISRTVDNLACYFAVYFSYPEVNLFSNYSIFFAIFLSVLIDVIFIYYFGRTFGKALMRLRVVPATGNNITLAMSVKRASSLWAFGLGLGIVALAPIFDMISIAFYLRNARTIWDEWAETKVEVV